MFSDIHENTKKTEKRRKYNFELGNPIYQLSDKIVVNEQLSISVEVADLIEL